MTPIIHFKCRACEREISISPSRTERVACPHCKSEIPVFMDDSMVGQGIVSTCVSCGHDNLYVQKDFNRKLGMVIVGAGIAASLYFFARSQPVQAMASLGATALVDFLVYFLV